MSKTVSCVYYVKCQKVKQPDYRGGVTGSRVVANQVIFDTCGQHIKGNYIEK